MTRSRSRPGSRLLSAWAIAAVIYVAVAAALSVGPIRQALAQAAAPPTTAPKPAAPRHGATTGPIPDAPDTPAVKVGKAVARQAAIVFVPPALILWFGWDVWFAVTGFFPRRRKPAED